MNHELATEIIDADGSSLLGGQYDYASAGIHSVINLGSSMTAQLYNYWAGWAQVRSSSQFQCSGNRGYYAAVLRGFAGTHYRVCANTP